MTRLRGALNLTVHLCPSFSCLTLSGTPRLLPDVPPVPLHPSSFLPCPTLFSNPPRRPLGVTETLVDISDSTVAPGTTVLLSPSGVQSRKGTNPGNGTGNFRLRRGGTGDGEERPLHNLSFLFVPLSSTRLVKFPPTRVEWGKGRRVTDGRVETVRRSLE